MRNLIVLIESQFDREAFTTPRKDIEALADKFQAAYAEIGALKEHLINRYFEGVKANASHV